MAEDWVPPLCSWEVGCPHVLPSVVTSAKGLIPETIYTNISSDWLVMEEYCPKRDGMRHCTLEEYKADISAQIAWHEAALVRHEESIAKQHSIQDANMSEFSQRINELSQRYGVLTGELLKAREDKRRFEEDPIPRDDWEQGLDDSRRADDAYL